MRYAKHWELRIEKSFPISSPSESSPEERVALVASPDRNSLDGFAAHFSESWIRFSEERAANALPTNTPVGQFTLFVIGLLPVPCSHWLGSKRPPATTSPFVARRNWTTFLPVLNRANSPMCGILKCCPRANTSPSYWNTICLICIHHPNRYAVRGHCWASHRSRDCQTTSHLKNLEFQYVHAFPA